MAMENPVLNDSAFRTASGEVGGARTGMSPLVTYLITTLLLALLAGGGVFGWSQVDVTTTTGGQQVALSTPDWVWLATLFVFILAIVSAFNPGVAPITAPLYALVEGSVLGVLSHYYEFEYDGIVLQAVTATVAIFAVMLLLYTTRIFKVTPGLVLGLMAAMGALALLFSLAWIVAIFGGDIVFWDEPNTIGIAVSVGIVLIGALNLPVDFSFIERASEAGAPLRLAWFGAFGLMLSLIWLYVSMLRLLVLVRAANR